MWYSLYSSAVLTSRRTAFIVFLHSLTPEFNERIIFTDNFYEIGQGLTLFSCNDRQKNTELGSFGLNMLINDKLIPDDFRHEQYLLIEENGIIGISDKQLTSMAVRLFGLL